MIKKLKEIKNMKAELKDIKEARGESKQVSDLEFGSGVTSVILLIPVAIICILCIVLGIIYEVCNLSMSDVTYGVILVLWFILEVIAFWVVDVVIKSLELDKYKNEIGDGKGLDANGTELGELE